MALGEVHCSKCRSWEVYLCYRGLHCMSCDYCTGDPIPVVDPDSPVHPGEWPYEGLTDPHLD